MGGYFLSFILYGQKLSREETFSQFFFGLFATVFSGEIFFIFQNMSQLRNFKEKEKEDFHNGLIG